MPPLHAGDDDYDDDDLPPDDERGRRRWLWIALAVLVALLVGLAAWLVVGNAADRDPTSPRTSISSGSTAATDAFLFDPADWIGVDYREARAQLEAADLTVTAKPATADQLAAGGRALNAKDVALTDPDKAGPLDPGSKVVLYYSEKAYAPDSGEESEAPASSTSAAPTSSSAAPTSKSSAAPTSSEAPSSSAAPETTQSSPPPASGTPETSASESTPAESPGVTGAAQGDGGGG